MKIRLELTPAEIKQAKSLGLRPIPNRRGDGARVYINDATQALEIISKLSEKPLA